MSEVKYPHLPSDHPDDAPDNGGYVPLKIEKPAEDDIPVRPMRIVDEVVRGVVGDLKEVFIVDFNVR